MNETLGKIVRCPSCGGDTVYGASNPMRPFCSNRCKKMDLGAWASEKFTVHTEAPIEDISFGDTTLPLR
jgi:endogenous inhibitor of DNA gyrase (YacG/DUF329 family)